MSNETANSPTALSPNAFSWSGYNFTGWNTQANGTGTPYADSASYPFNADATLYAQWKEIAVPHATRLVGKIFAGRTQTVTIIGSAFTGVVKVTSNAPGTRVRILRVASTRVLVRITLSKGAHKGRHTLRLILHNGKTCAIRYLSE